MNRENVLRVADAIEQHSIPDLGFNMSSFVSRYKLLPDRSGHNCNTTACIAGWARKVRSGRLKYPDINQFNWSKEAEWLGLSRDEGKRLFYADNEEHGFLHDYRPSQAVAVLRHLAETGKVDWTVADEVKP